MRAGVWARYVMSGAVCAVASGCLLPDLKKKPYEEGELGEGGMVGVAGRTGGASATSSAAPKGGSSGGDSNALRDETNNGGTAPSGGVGVTLGSGGVSVERADVGAIGGGGTQDVPSNTTAAMTASLGGVTSTGGAQSAAVIGKVSTPCDATEQQYGCADHAVAQAVVCRDGRWEINGICEYGQLCDSRPGSDAGTCKPIAAGCNGRTPGDSVCNGQTIEICGPDLVTVTVGAKCVSQSCSNGVCRGVCEAGEKRCSGNVTRTCSVVGQWEQTSCSGATPVCAGAGLCVACAAGDKRCNGNTPQTCSSAGQWQDQTACSGVTPICRGDGVCVACSAGTKQCSGKTPQTCSSAGEWESQNSCAQSEICSNGTCVKCPGTGGPTMVGLPLGYCIDSTEVTRIQYAAWLSSTSSATLEAQDAANCGWNKSFTPSSDWTSLTPAGPNKPVAYVDWCDAYAYCKGVGKRLCGMQGGGSNPFEKYAELQSSQWYAACTSNGPNSYSYGSTYEPTKCNGQDAAIDATVAVGARTGCTPTVIGYQGIYDLSGNVSEWEDSCEPREAAVYCRLRGGNYTLGAAFVMCGTHAEAPRSDAHAEFGFRCCAF